jgi:RNA polymerase-interacting CarD/CdnL/TRCF family regulator
MSEEMYVRGDWIVHAHYGVGQVKGKDNKILDGEKTTFLRVKTFTSEYYLPIKSWDVSHIRPLSSEYQIKKALSILRKPAEPLSKDHKQRSKQISEAASDISIYSKAEIIRDLYGRRRAGNLNLSETELLEKIINHFLNEWSIVANQEKTTLKEKLDRALQTSYEKLKDEKDESWLEKVRKGVKQRRKSTN